MVCEPIRTTKKKGKITPFCHIKAFTRRRNRCAGDGSSICSIQSKIFIFHLTTFLKKGCQPVVKIFQPNSFS